MYYVYKNDIQGKQKEIINKNTYKQTKATIYYCAAWKVKAF